MNKFMRIAGLILVGIGVLLLEGKIYPILGMILGVAGVVFSAYGWAIWASATEADEKKNTTRSIGR